MSVRVKSMAGAAALLVLAATTSIVTSLLLTKVRGGPSKSQLSADRAQPVEFGAWRIGIDPDYAQSYSFLVVRNEAPTPGWIEFAIDTYLWYGPKMKPMRPPFRAVQLKVEVYHPDDEDGKDVPFLTWYSQAVEPQAGIPYRGVVPFGTTLPPGSYPVRISLESLLPEEGEDEPPPPFCMTLENFNIT